MKKKILIIVGVLIFFSLSCITIATKDSRKYDAFYKDRTISFFTNFENGDGGKNNVRIVFSKNKYSFYNRSYCQILFENFERYNPKRGVGDFLCYMNDTVFLVNAIRDSLTKEYRALKENVFISFNSFNREKYVSTTLFGCEQKFIEKYFCDQIKDSIYVYELNIDVSEEPYISELRISKTHGIFSFVYYNGDYSYLYERKKW